MAYIITDYRSLHACGEIRTTRQLCIIVKDVTRHIPNYSAVREVNSWNSPWVRIDL